MTDPNDQWQRSLERVCKEIKNGMNTDGLLSRSEIMAARDAAFTADAAEREAKMHALAPEAKALAGKYIKHIEHPNAKIGLTDPIIEEDALKSASPLLRALKFSMELSHGQDPFLDPDKMPGDAIVPDACPQPAPSPNPQKKKRRLLTPGSP
jgi:hypothetical protein